MIGEVFYMKEKNPILLACAIVLLAFCMRAPFTVVGSVLTFINEDLHLSGSASGMLTTVPVLCFAFLSLFVDGCNRRFGAGKLMLLAMLTMAAGILLRNVYSTSGLFIGTILIGAAIAVCNVMMPTLVKAFFPERLGLMTGIYTTAMSLVAGIGSSLSVAIAVNSGWKASLTVWIIPVVIAILCWMPYRKTSTALENQTKGLSLSFLFRSRTAWWAALYMGIQCMMYYCYVAWFPTILQQIVSAEMAGMLTSVYMFISIPASFLTPIIADKMKNQSLLGVIIGVLYVIAMVSLMFCSNPIFLVLTLLCGGICAGASFSYILALFAMHTKNAADATSLSGFAQSVGNLIAAIGPALMGQLLDRTGSWTIPLGLLSVISVSLIILGYLVGRNEIIAQE